MRRLLPPLRLRVIVLTGVMVSTMLGLEAAPLPAPADGPVSAPLPFGLGPDAALAAYCASNPTFTGRLTSSSSSTTAVSRITSANVYGYISNVNSAWSCTLYRRYSAIAWNTTGTTGRFNWGTLINSTSVACNWVVGSTDYLKADDTADCADSDAEYAMQVTLTGERVYQADVGHDTVGDFSFAHADCDTTPYYGAEIGKGSEASPVSFSSGSTANRPGANCDPITLDGTGTSQTVTYDATAPATTITAPAATAKQAATGYTVGWQATDSVAKFGGTSDWDLQRQIATASGGSCGTFANDPAAGNLVSGTQETAQSQTQTALAHARCYRWTLAATDQNGNAAALDTSPAVLIDTTAPVPNFATPDEGATLTNGTTTYSVAWTESDPESGVTGRSLQRQRATLTGGTCGTWSNDGSAVTTVSNVPLRLLIRSGVATKAGFRLIEVGPLDVIIPIHANIRADPPTAVVWTYLLADPRAPVTPAPSTAESCASAVATVGPRVAASRAEEQPRRAGGSRRRYPLIDGESPGAPNRWSAQSIGRQPCTRELAGAITRRRGAARC